MPVVWRIGLTGGIGSGKSTVSRMLHQYGAVIIDADAVSRSVTQTGGQAIASIREAFGSEYITGEGAMDRDKMRSLIYSDSAARQRLESIVHPLVGQETARQADRAIKTGVKVIVFDIPLLVESKRWRSNLDLVLVVDCLPAIQIARVVARSGLTEVAVQGIIASQATRETRLQAADIVLSNTHMSLADLAREVGQILPRFGLSSPQPQA